MADTSSLEQDNARDTAIRGAADELATRLSTLADTLSATKKPIRVSYGRGRFGTHVRRHSPKGFVLDPAGLQVLMPDGRLWTYSRNDASRHPAGRLYNPRVDYAVFSGSRTFFGGIEFVFLGAVLGKYTFGFAAPSDGDNQPAAGGLCAVYGDGHPAHYVTADEAFTAIAQAAANRNSDASRSR